MHEIIFRGKCIDDSKWIEGFYAKTSQRWSDEVIHFIFTEEDIDDYLIVDPETVGQYTGLKDKNGKRIFEGDIIRETGYGVNYSIEWSQESLCYFIKTLSGKRDYLCDIFYDCVVIGNRWDSPELFEAQE